MPLRNLLLIAVTAILSILCYQQADRNRYSSILSEVMGVVERNYVEPVQRRDLFEHAMQGMMGGLDPYSGYIPPSEYVTFKESIEQKFGGVGILVEIHPETKRLTVMSPLFGTPAYEAGILSGDTILSIDGKSTEGLDLRDSVSLMRGAPDTPVTVEILHRGEKEPLQLTLTRTIIHTESVLGDKRIEGGKWDYRLQEDKRIGYIRITSFGDETVDELHRALTDAQGKAADYDGLIIDLRSNPGGTLTAAVDICDMFLDEGVIVSTRGRDGVEKKTEMATPGVVVPSEWPVAILVNHYSASASEIVAARLQDHKRATIVGERTWGKGTVQNVIQLENGKSAVRLTTASYWRPSNKNIHRTKDAKETDEWGVSPNAGYEVKLSDKEFEQVIEARARQDKYRPYDESSTPDAPPPPKNPASPPDTKPASPPADDAPASDKPFDDPQLRKAIDFIQQQLSAANAASGKA